MGDTDREDIRQFLVSEGISSPNNALINQVRNAGSENEIRRIIAAVKPTAPASALASAASPAAVPPAAPAAARNGANGKREAPADDEKHDASPNTTWKRILVTKTQNASGADKYTAIIESSSSSSSSSGSSTTPMGTLPNSTLISGTGNRAAPSGTGNGAAVSSGGRHKRRTPKRTHKNSHKRSHKRSRRTRRR